MSDLWTIVPCRNLIFEVHSSNFCFLIFILFILRKSFLITEITNHLHYLCSLFHFFLNPFGIYLGYTVKQVSIFPQISSWFTKCISSSKSASILLFFSVFPYNTQMPELTHTRIKCGLLHFSQKLFYFYLSSIPLCFSISFLKFFF